MFPTKLFRLDLVVACEISASGMRVWDWFGRGYEGVEFVMYVACVFRVQIVCGVILHNFSFSFFPIVKQTSSQLKSLIYC